MTHFLNRILPFLFTKPKPAAPAPKHPMETAEEFACILRRFADATDNDLARRIYELAGRLSCATTLSHEEAVCYSALGTPQAIYNFLEGFFEQVELEEYWQYDGDPFHFRVTVSGEWNEANEAWLRRAVAASKNVRSVLDGIAVGSAATITVHGEGGAYPIVYPLAGEDALAGMRLEVTGIDCAG